MSGGVIGEGGKLFLYRQTNKGDVTKWTYLGPFFETGFKESWSSWSGSESSFVSPFNWTKVNFLVNDSDFGINYETASVTRLNPSGDALDDGSDTSAVDFVSMGTEQGEDRSLTTPLLVSAS